jgi:orotidine 5'-phosphate decarboxylase subfamily 1
MRKRLPYAQRALKASQPLNQKLFTLMENKKTNLALAADVTTTAELLQLADTLGPEICILKTHIDIINDFSKSLTDALTALAVKHRFLIFEDRKFADIGNTVKQQYAHGIYEIVNWADIINAHALPGPGVITGLAAAGLAKSRGLLLLAEMSSAGNLLDKNYADKTLQMAEANPEFIMGFIAQRKLSTDARWIYLTPGVQLGATNDSMGQQYISPQQAILDNASDIIIVGRGITAATNPVEAAKRYRASGWEAYQKSLALSDINNS